MMPEDWTPPTDEEWERIIREAREEEFEIHVQQALEIVSEDQ